MTEHNLPAPLNTPDDENTKGIYVQVEPGSWWRLVDPNHSLTSGEAPDHGIVLPVLEARVVDGSLHTVIVGAHPLWKTTSHRLLAEEFLSVFRPEPDGEAIRETEIAAVMGRVNEISQDIGQPPSDSDLLALPAPGAGDRDAAPTLQQEIDRKKSGQPGAAAHVPAALLPGGDIQSAQDGIERQIAIMEARKAWTLQKTREMQAQMDLVGTYQKEKVATTMARISDSRDRAEKLLSNVTTMRLFLGEDLEVETLISGKSADAEEPLVFMQRMLYLDEEIHCLDLLDGVTSDDMVNLASFFASEPRLIGRMLPHPRCVVLARIRRERRDRSGNRDISMAGIFQEMQQDQADARILVFIRDGENLHIVMADEQTSAAQRLFPSEKEIQDLFENRRFLSSEARTITPDHIEYTDARAKHDERALFYKRFLIMFWGLHERLGLFGPFMERDTNWLLETTHSGRFSFVHDEEMTLTDGRVNIMTFLRENRTHLAPGARVVVNWAAAVDSIRAPSICRYQDQHEYRIAEFVRDIDVDIASKSKNDIVVRAECLRDTWSSNPKSFRARVALSRMDRDGAPDIADGFAVLDRISLEEVTYYIENREARRHHRTYLHVFSKIRQILLGEKEASDRIIADLTGRTGADDHLARKVLLAWRGQNRWKFPETPAARALLTGMLEKLLDPATVEYARKAAGPDLVQVLVGGDGTLCVDAPIDQSVFPEGFRAPCVRRLTFSLKGRSTAPGGLKLLRDEEIEADAAIPPGKVEIDRNQDALDRVLENRNLFPAGVTPAQMSSGGFSVDPGNIQYLHGSASEPDPFRTQHLVETLYDSYTSIKGSVHLGDIATPIGLFAVTGIPGSVRNGIQGYTQTSKAWLLYLHVDVDHLAITTGESEMLLSTLGEVYANPGLVLERRKKRSENTRSILSIRAIPITGLNPVEDELGWEDPLLAPADWGARFMSDHRYGDVDSQNIFNGLRLEEKILAGLIWTSEVNFFSKKTWMSDKNISDIRSKAKNAVFLGPDTGLDIVRDYLTGKLP